MSSTFIKYPALKILGDLIEARIPELSGRVCVGPAGAEHLLAFPCLVVLATSWRLRTHDPDPYDRMTGDLREPQSGTVIYRVGEWEADVELRVGATTAQERYQLGEKVEQLFFDGSGSCTHLADDAPFLRPGVILCDIPECYDERVAFLLNESTWEDELVFTKELFAILRIKAEVPVLATQYDQATISDLRLALTESMETIALGGDLPPGTEIYPPPVSGFSSGFSLGFGA